ncbi:hypothetical protein WJX74_002126 [Apatococcus lobatus]|uniref:N-alpha-acetyltransferase 60 n=1 Tax=Apatococcus lobatus TaxID=904363 RepID=A0AAW1S0Z4_9CHLO
MTVIASPLTMCTPHLQRFDQRFQFPALIEAKPWPNPPLQSVAQAGTLGATRTVAGGDCAGQRHGKSQASCKMDISFRPLAEWDRAELVALHVALFPINYEDGFYNSALGNEGGFFTLAAIQRHSNGQEKMVGFITARLAPLHSLDPVDRSFMGLETRLADGKSAMYILTIGTAPQLQGRGIATELLAHAVRHAAVHQAAAVFLHVIIHNQAALNFYLRNGFAQAALLRDFYFIRSDRQPEPGREIYDAYLYVLLLEPAAVSHITPWALMQAAAGPFRDAWYHFTSYLQPVVRAAEGCWTEHQDAASSPGQTRPSSLNIVGTRVPDLEASGPSLDDAMALRTPQISRSPPSPWLTRLFARQPLHAGNRDTMARM